MTETARRTIAASLGVLVVFACVAAPPASAAVRLPHVLGSKMVLQRHMPVPVWGWADAGENIAVKLGRHEVTTAADAEGKWEVKLPAMKAGGPFQMTVSGSNTIELTDIMVGEVWFCAGQSNMEMGILMAENAKEEIAKADDPAIRLFSVPCLASGLPAPDVNADWRVCSPKTIVTGGWGGFSAVAYFFGREIRKELDVPVGLVKAAWGGTYILPWTPRSGFASVPKLDQIKRRINLSNTGYRDRLDSKLNAVETWIKAAREALAEDKPLPFPPTWPTHPYSKSTVETGLYNGMVRPIIPFAIRGAIWYQGEADRRLVPKSGDAMIYHEKMKALVLGWRKEWGQGDFPFYFVQLAPFKNQDDPLKLPKIWEAQTAGLSIPNTGMAVTVDVGDLKSIHPRKKQDVGKRLSLWALAKTYGRTELVHSGPLYKSMTVEEGKINIQFDHVAGGLVSHDNKPLTWFSIAGPDRNFVTAKAQVRNNEVLVWSETVPKPVAVRFAWHQEAQPNLMNKEGLPASPFRTDRW